MNWTLSSRARLDVRAILSASGDQFGESAQRRYRMLLEQAIEDVAANPRRRGVHGVEAQGVYLYHARHARARTPADQRVGRPRHLIVFEVVDDEIRVLRVLHDAMDLPEQLKDI